MGPLLFSLALHPILRQLKDTPGLDVVVGYLDEDAVAGNDVAVLRAVELIQSTAPQIGLELNLSKCVLAPPAGLSSECDLHAYPGVIKRYPTSDFKLLGSPVGSASYTATFMRDKRVAKAKSHSWRTHRWLTSY